MTCPTPCDPDCDADCHESHEVPSHRGHQPQHCGHAAIVAEVLSRLGRGDEAAAEIEARCRGPYEVLQRAVRRRERRGEAGAGKWTSGSVMGVLGRGGGAA